MAIKKKKKREFAPTHFDRVSYHFILITLVLIFAIIILRTIEISLFFKYYSLPVSPTKYILASYFYDFLFVLNIAGVIIIPYILFFFIAKYIAEIFYGIVGVFAIVFNFFLSLSFIYLNAPLSLEAMQSPGLHYNQVLSHFSFTTFLIIVFILALSAGLYLIIMNFKFKRAFYIGVFVVSLFSLFLINNTFPKSEYFYHEDTYHLVVNKTSYIIRDYFFKDNTAVEEGFTYVNPLAEKKEKSLVDEGYNKINSVYPVLRISDSLNTLKPYFNLDSNEKPNIVLIIVNGLGRAFSGDNAYLGSYTPNLDKLGKKSLVWNNFISCSAKPFNILPSILASLPYSTEASEFNYKFPEYFSIVNILKKAGYKSTLYLSGEQDNEFSSNFIKTVGFDKILDSKDINSTISQKNILLAKHATIPVDDFLEFYINSINKNDSVPRLDIIQINLLDFESDKSSAENYYDKFDNLNPKANIEFKKEKYKEDLSCVISIDEALKKMFVKLDNTNESKNTIFVITGSNKLSSVPSKSRISKYHVPFIIYSPMLTKHITSNGVSSHRDFANSLLNLLKSTYPIETPDTIHWTGSMLDISPTFRNIHSIPLHRNKATIDEFIDHQYFISGHQMFKVVDNLGLDELKNGENFEVVNGKLTEYKDFSSYIYREHKIIPKEIVLEFIK